MDLHLESNIELRKSTLGEPLISSQSSATDKDEKDDAFSQGETKAWWTSGNWMRHRLASVRRESVADITVQNVKGGTNIGGRFRKICQSFFYSYDRSYTNCITFFVMLLVSVCLCFGILFYGTIFIALMLARNSSQKETSNTTTVNNGTAAQVPLAISIEAQDVLDNWSTISANLAVLTVLSCCVIILVKSAKNIRNGSSQWQYLATVLFISTLTEFLWTIQSFILKDIINSLTGTKDENLYYRAISAYLTTLFAMPFLYGVQYFARYLLSLKFRKYLTLKLVRGYMKDLRYYNLNSNEEANTAVDNPDQRITDDIEKVTLLGITLSISLYEAMISFFMNFLILLKISPKLSFILFVYAFFSSAMMCILLIFTADRTRVQQKVEANFRFGVINIRNNAEQIAFYSGEESEIAELDDRFDSVYNSFYWLNMWRTAMKTAELFFHKVAKFLPYAVVAPMILMGGITYGEFGQIEHCYWNVHYGVWFIFNNWQSLVSAAASVDRLYVFQEYVNGDDMEAKQVTKSKLSTGIVLENVTVKTPQQKVVVRNLNIRIERGEMLLLKGNSGIGKTSLLRAIAGLWPIPYGQISKPDKKDIFFVPQKPYMKLGTLRDQLCYPRNIIFSDYAIQQTLHEVRLSNIAEEYSNIASIRQDWARVLSLGEQQRLSFARILLYSPKFVILDEATSAIDIDTERHLYGLLEKRGVTCVSVGHRPTLAKYHGRSLELIGRGEWKVETMKTNA
jgi:putative ATP-binding cassette transporter